MLFGRGSAPRKILLKRTGSEDSVMVSSSAAIDDDRIRPPSKSSLCEAGT